MRFHGDWAMNTRLDPGEPCYGGGLLSKPTATRNRTLGNSDN